VLVMTEVGGPARSRLGVAVRSVALAAAVAVVVGLDTGAVPLPYSAATGPFADGAAHGGTTARATPGDAVLAGVKARDASIQAAVTTMNSAYAAGDEPQFLSVVDAVDAALVGRIRQIYRNLRLIGYSGVRFEWRDGAVRALPSGSPNADPNATVAPVLAPLTVRTQVTGFDPKPAAVELGLTFAVRSGRWLVVGDADTGADVRASAAEPWMVAPVTVVRRAHVLVIGDAAKKAAVERLATRLETEVATVRGVWKVSSWNGKVVAYASTNRRFLNVHFKGQEATGKKTAEAVFDAKVTMLSTSADGGSAPPAAARMIVTPYLLGQDTAESRAVLRHELTHVAFAFVVRDGTPSWLIEGSAEYTAYRTGGARVDGVGALAKRGLPEQTWTELRRGTWKPTLVADPATFYEGSGKRVSAAYTTAWLTCLYIADRFGERSLTKLYSAAAAATSDNPDVVEAAILVGVLKTGRGPLLSGVRSYAKRIRSRFV
jgi:hypothetical protein